MTVRRLVLTVLLLLLGVPGAPLALAKIPDAPAVQPVYLDSSGVIRWQGSKKEVALFGANYCIMSGSDYRMAVRVSADRKAMIDEDVAQFARMGWTGMRLCSWGDWESSDRDGNLIVNDHVDLLDYLIAKARERGIYLLLTPIHTYDPAYADETGQPSKNIGFSRYFEREVMGTDPRSRAAQTNYIRQLLNHVNPYTHTALKNEPAILFIEMINEPVHHPQNLPASVAYINALVQAVRGTGCTKLTFFNVSQDFAIAPALQASKVDGITFGWYPTGLVSGHELHGNFLPAVDAYPDMLRPELRGKPRIVYEFDQADLLSGYLYPAMARTFRSVGGQFAAMFAYDMLQTAPFNLSWQTHFLNLVHTPKKAVSAMIAAEAMRRLPRLQSYGRYPASSNFGDFRVSYEEDASLLNADDAFMNAGATATPPRKPGALLRIAGLGASPVVGYEGTGAYFLDKIRDGLWRLEVYPDQVLVRDPFEQPEPGKVVSRLLYRNWPMQVKLPDLGQDFFVRAAGKAALPAVRKATDAKFPVEPGVWLLSTQEVVAAASLPATINRVGMSEFHVNPRSEYPDLILPLAPREYRSGDALNIRVRVADTELPDAVSLWVRSAGHREFGKPLPMQRDQGNDYVATLPVDTAPGLYEYAVSVKTGERVTTFPGAISGRPIDWPFPADASWPLRISAPDSSLRLFDPKQDYPRLAYVRPGEQYRSAWFDLLPGESSEESALGLSLPNLGSDTPERYAAALYIGDVTAPRHQDLKGAQSLHVKLRAVGGMQKTLQVTLVERDGAAWSAWLPAGRDWNTISLPLVNLKPSRSIHIPSPYPGLWNYWRESPVGRGGAGDRIQAEEVERLQLSVSPNAQNRGDDAQGVAVESIGIDFTAH